MKHLFLLIFFIGSALIVTAQSYGVINDKDGFVNVRKSPGVNSPIVGKLYADQLFLYGGENKSSWVQIFRQKESTAYFLEGYVSKNKVLGLSSFKKISKLKIYKYSCVAYNDSLSITIQSSPFNAKKHQLHYSKPGKNELAVLMKIDGKNVWGQDGGMPKKDISFIKVIKNGIHIDIPKSAYEDLHEPNFNSTNIYINKNRIYIEMLNSDGAGGYTIIWTIKDNKYAGRYIGTY